MNICAGDGWGTLCPFLEKEIPDVPFPKTNVFGISDFAAMVKKRQKETDLF